MQVVRHSDPDTFLEAAVPITSRGEASASFFTGAAHSLKRTPPRAADRVYLATCTGAEGFGVAIQRDDGPVLIGESDVAAAKAFADELARDWLAKRSRSAGSISPDAGIGCASGCASMR